MKINKLILVAVMALLGAALLEGSAKAQGYAPGDLLLLFRVDDGTGTGSTTNLQVNLGLASSFNFATSQTVAGLSALSTDLSTTYGASWATRGDLQFTIVAALTSGPTEYLSDPGNSAYAVTTSLQGNESTLSSLYSESAGTLVSGPAYAVSTSDNYSFSNVLTNANGQLGGPPYSNDYGFIPGPIGTSEAIATSGGSSLDLYDINTTTGKNATTSDPDLGTFTLTGSGTLQFVAEGSVPEPSSYALMLAGALVLFVMRRRAFTA